MSSLKFAEKKNLETVLQMGGGYVLDFSNASFANFFRDFQINIYDPKYIKNSSSSKANLLRVFWEIESDTLVGKALEAMLELRLLQQTDPVQKDDPSFVAARAIALRLQGRPEHTPSDEAAEFLKREFGSASLSKLNITPALLPILEDRLAEASQCLKNNIPLLCVIAIGSLLEGILLDVASKSPAKFNQSTASPKDSKTGKPLQFHEWKLSSFIDVAYEIGLIKTDVKRFSHDLRDFRNYIHPYHQMVSKFNPDIHTAKICFQVLKAGIADLSGHR